MSFRVSPAEALNGRSGDSWAKTREKVSNVLAAVVKRRLTGKYRLECVDIVDQNIVAKFYAVDQSRSTLLGYTRSPALWADCVYRIQEDARLRVRDELRKATRKQVSVDACWSLGSGVEVLDRPVGPDSPERSLQERLRELRKRDRWLWPRKVLGMVLPLICVGLGILLFFVVDRVAAFFAFAYGAIFLVAWPIAASIQSGVRAEIREIEAQLDLRGLLSDDKDQRAAYKLFQVNNLELHRYYDQALRQRALVFLLGVGCIVAGFAAVGGALFAVTREGANSTERITIAVLGAIGGILANFVAAIFLRMFGDIVKSMTVFHNRLVVTHHAHFGNLIAARIGDGVLRNETLARMALAIGVLDAQDRDGTGGQSEHKDTG